MFIGLLLVSLLVPSTALADSVVSQGYQVQGNLPAGAAVSLSQSTLSLASATNAQYLYGVVVQPSDVSLNINSASNQVQVVTAGLVPTAVSDINGDIKAGDNLVPSPIAGVVMKGTEAGKSLGAAEQDFNVRGSNVQAKTITAKDGTTRQVHIGLIPVAVGVGDFQPKTAPIPAFLLPVQGALSGIAGHDVSSVRTTLALSIFLLALIATLVILYSATTGAIRSIGRNPLAKSAVFVSLLQVVAIIVVILLVAFSIILVIIRG